MNEHVEPRTAAVLHGYFQGPAGSTLAEHWAAVALAEASDPNVLRALRDQQQHLQSTGVLS